jgi:uncharacterized SAM-binding protein YcdF (DUF218 family)
MASTTTPLETASTSTRENAFCVKSLLRSAPDSRGVLTDNAHTFWVRRALKQAGLEVATWPAEHTARPTRRCL